MTREERTEVTLALNDAKRGWMEAQGGYAKIETDAKALERTVARRAQPDDIKAVKDACRRKLSNVARARKRARRSVDELAAEKRRSAQLEKDIRRLARDLERAQVDLRLALHEIRAKQIVGDARKRRALRSVA